MGNTIIVVPALAETTLSELMPFTRDVAVYIAFPPLFLQVERNLWRSLPCRPLASACFEHSSDTALRSVFVAVLAFGAAVGAGAVFAAGAAAGAVDWAEAGPASSRAATVVARAREDNLIMVSPDGWRGLDGRAAMLNGR